MKAAVSVLALSLALVSGALAEDRAPVGYGPLNAQGVRQGPSNCDKAIVMNGTRWCRSGDAPADLGKNSLKLTDWSASGSGGDSGSSGN